MTHLNHHNITPANAKWAAQFLWNLSLEAIEEKYQKLGLSACIDMPTVKQAYHQQAYGKLAEELEKLTRLLKDDAKDELDKFLSLVDPLP